MTKLDGVNWRDYMNKIKELKDWLNEIKRERDRIKEQNAEEDRRWQQIIAGHQEERDAMAKRIADLERQVTEEEAEPVDPSNDGQVVGS